MNLVNWNYKWSVKNDRPCLKEADKDDAVILKSTDKGVLNGDAFISSKTAPAFRSVNPAMADLRKYANDFKCAYTGLRMLSFSTYQYLMQLAGKNKNTDKNLINHIAKYRELMDGIELDVLKFYKHKLNVNNKSTIQEVTEEQFPKSYNKLKIQYLKVVEKLRGIVDNIKNEKVRLRYLAALDGWEEDLLKGNYKSAINMCKYQQILQKMNYGKENQMVKSAIDSTLQGLPLPVNDFDSFIVRSKDSSKRQFVNRLISPFVVSIEHIKAKRNGGHASSISNCILVRSKENWEKSDTPLSVSLEKHPERVVHLQEYYKHVIDKINNGGMKEYLWYPYEIKKTLEYETKNKLVLDSSKLKISEEDAYKSFKA